jgi:hypothetical protein
VEALWFLTAGTWRLGRPLRAATSVLAETVPPPRRSGCRLASDRVALRGDTRGPSSFRLRLSRALTGALSVLRRRRAHSVRSSGRRGVNDRCDGDRSWPGRPPCAKLVAVGNAHEVAVHRGLKVQAPEPDFESGWEGVRAAHRIPLAPVLGADHHREGLLKLIFSAKSPYLARQMSVRKVVPTLTSKSAKIYPSMAGAKQLGDTRFILVPAGAVRLAGMCSGHCIVLHCGACRGVLQARRERRLVLEVLEVLIEASADIRVKGKRRMSVHHSSPSFFSVPRGWGTAPPFIDQGESSLQARRTILLRATAWRAVPQS